MVGREPSCCSWCCTERRGGALKILVEQPGIGTKVETGRSPQVRRFLLSRTNYFLYYRVRRAELEVLSVWHTSREHDPSVWQMTPNIALHRTALKRAPGELPRWLLSYKA